MARIPSLVVLATLVTAPAIAQDHPAVVHAPPPVAITSTPKAAQDDATGEFVDLEGIVDPERAKASIFPPAGIVADFQGLANMGTCFPIYRLRVPAARVSEAKALLSSIAPQFQRSADGWYTYKAP